MDICFLIPLLWVLGASALAGLLGWLWGKKEGATSSVDLNAKDLEIQNLKKQIVEVKDKTDNALATLGRESRESEEKVQLWKEKFNKLQLKASKLSPAVPQDNKELKAALAKIKTLEADKNALMLLSDEHKIKKSSKQKVSNKEDLTQLKKEHKEEIKKYKSKLKKAKQKNKILKEKGKEIVTQEIEITKSIDLETLKKWLDKAPLKKVSERIVNRKSSK